MGNPARHIVRSLQLAETLAKLADDGMADSPDEGCLALFGLVLDSSHRIRRQAEQEREAHRMQGRWVE